MAKGSPNKAEIRELLHRLNSSDAGAAWAEFVDNYAPLIMSVVGQIEFEQERSDDCFLYVCEKLSENGFKRLLKFNPSGTAKLSSWLSTVVFNLCVDWHRKEYGRVRMLTVISALAEFDQAVYRLVHEDGMSRESAYQRLHSKFPDLKRESVSSALRRIHKVLTPRQRWRMSLRDRQRATDAGNLNTESIEQYQDPGQSPESAFQSAREIELLEIALSKLPAEKRLLLHWRFQEGLTLKRIARLSDLGRTHRVWTELQRAIAALFEHSDELSRMRDKKI